MATRPEFSNSRSLAFSAWIRKELPDSSSGLCVTNQDWILWNFKTRRLMLIEEKTHLANIAPWFARLIKEVLHPALKEYCAKNNINYLGYHLVQFENESPTDGRIWFDGREIAEASLNKLLSI